MRCHPSHWRTPSFCRGVVQPETAIPVVSLLEKPCCVAGLHCWEKMCVQWLRVDTIQKPWCLVGDEITCLGPYSGVFNMNGGGDYWQLTFFTDTHYTSVSIPLIMFTLLILIRFKLVNWMVCYDRGLKSRLRSKEVTTLAIILTNSDWQAHIQASFSAVSFWCIIFYIYIYTYYIHIYILYYILYILCTYLYTQMCTHVYEACE